MFSLKKSNNSDLHTSTTSAPASQSDLYDVIFPLLRASLWGEDKFPFTAPPNTDWDAVYEELCHQTVQHLPVDILCREDPKNRQKYILNATRAVRNWHKIMQAQQDLYELFQKEGIPFVILKGAAADCYYPKPEYRCMGDIDLIVKPEDFERAKNVMVEWGCIEQDDKNDRHIEYKNNNILIELHHSFARFNIAEHIKLLDNYIFSAIDHRKELSLNCFSFPVLPKLENGVILLEHINQHLESGLGLRQIIDWALFANKELDDSSWYSEYQQIIQPTGMSELAITTTKLCQLYLGLNPDITWCKDADSNLCIILMEYVIEKGNFGRKMSQDRKNTIDTLNTARDTMAFFKQLQNRGCYNWKLLHKHQWLKPFAWLYQICRYIYLGLMREHPFQSLYEDSKKSKIHDTLFERLGVNRRHKGITHSTKKNL